MTPVATGADTTIDDDRVRRDEVSPSEWPDDEQVRVYYTPDFTFVGPSVTTVTDCREDPEKDEALDGWRDAYDGQSSYARPWWRDQMVFKQLRGTLAHYAMLATIGDPSGDTYYHRVGSENYGFEEYQAEYHLRKWSQFAPSASVDDQLTPRNNEYDGEHAWDRAMRDISWCVDAFKDWWRDDWTVLETETFVTATPLSSDGVARGYGGQLDLFYENHHGETVVCDLKTSSGIRTGYKLQLAAYARALDRHVDRLEVARFHPDSETVEVEDDTDWQRTRQGLDAEFVGLLDQAHHVEYADVLDSDVITDLLS
jgi:hypothetical protein